VGMTFEYYLSFLDYSQMPEFMQKYLHTESIERLRYVSYFCGMNYASPFVYDFSESITRFDHSLSVALLVYRYTHNRLKTIAGLCHDIATPCFSHVIDYMNGDYVKQESTEEYTRRVILSDKSLLKCFREDGINPEDIINYKKFSVVDNDRPKLCADRLDGIILTGLFWAKNLVISDIEDILSSVHVFRNEFGEDELGFMNAEIARRIVKVSDEIDAFCHSKEDIYMMELLARITKLGIETGLYTYDDLYFVGEKDIFSMLKRSKDKTIIKKLSEFRNIKPEEIPEIIIDGLKVRDLNPLVRGKRLL